MMKKFSLALFLLITMDAFSGNPVMFVRCGPRVALTENINACDGCPSGYVFYDPFDQCSPATSKANTNKSGTITPAQCILEAKVDASAPSGYSCGPGLVLDSILVSGAGVVARPSYIYICVPDCKDVQCSLKTFTESASESVCPEIGWSLQHLQCGCEDPFSTASLEEDENTENTTGIFNPCGCPPGYGQDIVLRRIAGATFDPYSPCVIIESDDCYSGAVDFYIEPFTCESTNPDAVITIVITGPEGGPDFAPGDIVSIDELQNCVLTTDDLFLLALSEEYGVDASFVADSNGEVIIEFTRDPTEPSVLDFGGTEVMIPACTAANASTVESFDPCSCDNPENVLNAAQDAILYWKDVLTIIGTPGSVFKLTANNNPSVFLKTANSSDSYMVNDILGTFDSNGILEVPFFRDASTINQALDITFADATDPTIMGSDMSVCSEAPVPCLAQPIPTLGEWSIFILSLLILIIGVVGFSLSKKLGLVKIR